MPAPAQKVRFYPDLLQPALQAGVDKFPDILLTSWGPLLAFFMISFLSSRYGEDVLGSLPLAGGATTVSLIQAGVELVIDFFLTMLITGRLLDLQAKRALESLGYYTQEWTTPLTIETLRAAAKSLKWSVALLLPGIYWYFRLMFVPYVVMALPEYQKGEVDALERSSQLTKGIVPQLSGLAIAILALEMGGKVLSESGPVAGFFSLQVLISAVTMLFSVYTYIVIFELYQRRERQLAEGLI